MAKPLQENEPMSLDDFEELLLDKPENEKWELIGGRVVRGMVGARWEHNRIVGNIYAALLTGLRAKNSSCRPFAETFWLKQRLLKLAVFPDIIVHCAGLEPEAVSLDDPVVLVEVVSRGSVGRDRVEKWRSYQKLPSLRHYVLVERDHPAVDVFDRLDDAWRARPRLDDMSAELLLPAIDFGMRLAEIYRDVIGD